MKLEQIRREKLSLLIKYTLLTVADFGLAAHIKKELLRVKSPKI